MGNVCERCGSKTSPLHYNSLIDTILCLECETSADPAPCRPSAEP